MQTTFSNQIDGLRLEVTSPTRASYQDQPQNFRRKSFVKRGERDLTVQKQRHFLKAIKKQMK